MDIFCLDTPLDGSYAQAYIHGTWEGEGLCPGCKTAVRKLVEPVIIEWESGSDQIGDFTWLNFIGEAIVVTDRVRRAIEPEFECGFASPSMWQDPKLKRPVRMTKRSKPRVWLPYQGPTLWRMVAKGKARVDGNASNWMLKKTCPVCNKEFWYPPEQNPHLVVDRSTWSGHDIFRLERTGGTAVLVTERVKDLIESRGFTNIRLERRGLIPEL